MAGFTIPDQDAPPPPRAEQATVETAAATPPIEETGTPTPPSADQPATKGRTSRRPSTYVVTNGGGPFALVGIMPATLMWTWKT
ncbi:hypothetical protein GQ600_26848 [Phytophthora cactorum]|nr:hypothetical protein GQ600_26848 [Phytophthora cactorum]